MIKEYNAERDKKIAQQGSLMLYESYFLQYNTLLLNCEKQGLNFVNLDVYKIIENFWTDKDYYQFVIVMLVRAGVNRTLKIMWKLIINKKKEFLAWQVNALLQNTRSKEKQMEKLQMLRKNRLEWRLGMFGYQLCSQLLNIT